MSSNNIISNSKFNILLNNFKKDYENIILNLNKKLCFKKFETFLKNNHDNNNILKYFHEFLNEITFSHNNIKNKINNLSNEIRFVENNFVLLINEIASTLKNYTLKTRAIYKTFDNTKSLNDDLLNYYNNTREIIKKLKIIHEPNSILLFNEKNKKQKNKSFQKINLTVQNFFNFDKESSIINKINNNKFIHNYSNSKSKTENKKGKKNFSMDEKQLNKFKNYKNIYAKRFETSPNKTNNNIFNNNYIKNISRNNNNKSFSSNKFSDTDKSTNSKNILDLNIINIFSFILNFLNEMKNLQEAIVNKQNDVPQLKKIFEIKKNNLLNISKKVLNQVNNNSDINNSIILENINKNIFNYNELLIENSDYKSKNNNLKTQIKNMQNELINNNKNLNNILNKIKEDFPKNTISYYYNSISNSNANLLVMNSEFKLIEISKKNDLIYKEIINNLNIIKEKNKDKNFEKIYNSLFDIGKILDENFNANNSDDSINIINENNNLFNLLDESSGMQSRKSFQSTIINYSYNNILNMIEKIKKLIIEKKEELNKKIAEFNEAKNKLNNESNSLESNGNNRTFTFQSFNESKN